MRRVLESTRRDFRSLYIDIDVTSPRKTYGDNRYTSCGIAWPIQCNMEGSNAVGPLHMHNPPLPSRIKSTEGMERLKPSIL